MCLYFEIEQQSYQAYSKCYRTLNFQKVPRIIALIGRCQYSQMCTLYHSLPLKTSFMHFIFDYIYYGFLLDFIQYLVIIYANFNFPNSLLELYRQWGILNTFKVAFLSSVFYRSYSVCHALIYSTRSICSLCFQRQHNVYSIVNRVVCAFVEVTVQCGKQTLSY